MADAHDDGGPGGDAARLALAQDQRAGDALEQPGDRPRRPRGPHRSRPLGASATSSSSTPRPERTASRSHRRRSWSRSSARWGRRSTGSTAARRPSASAAAAAIGRASAAGPLELDDRQVAAAAGAGPAVGDLLGEQPVGRRQIVRSGGRQRIDQARQPLVELADADQEVQHALVDVQRGAGEDRAARDVDQPPAAQRRFRRQGGPVRLRQDGEGEAEVGNGRAGSLCAAAQSLGNSGSSSMPTHSSSSSGFKCREAECMAQAVERNGLCRAGRRPCRGEPAEPLLYVIKPAAQFRLVLLVALDRWVRHRPLPGSDGDQRASRRAAGGEGVPVDQHADEVGSRGEARRRHGEARTGGGELSAVEEFGHRCRLRDELQHHPLPGLDLRRDSEGDRRACDGVEAARGDRGRQHEGCCARDDAAPGCGTGGEPSCSDWTTCTAWTPAGKSPAGRATVMLFGETALGVRVMPLTSTCVVAGAVAARLVPRNDDLAPSPIAPLGSAALAMLPMTGRVKGCATTS